MDSIDPACNPLKHRYDACFIRWVEGYLEPLTGDSSPLPPPSTSKLTISPSTAPTKADPAIRAKEKAEEYERLCGESWREYKECVWKGVNKKGLTTLIESARIENPLLTIGEPVGEKGAAAAKR